MSYIIRPPKRRKQIINNLLSDIIVHEKVSVTGSYVKGLTKAFSKLVKWAKKGDLHSRRLSFRFLHSFKDVNIPNDQKNEMKNFTIVNKLFDEFGKRYRERNGGYTRVTHLGKRRGDASEIMLVSLV